MANIINYKIFFPKLEHDFFSYSGLCYLDDVYNTYKSMRYSVCLESFLTVPLKRNQYINKYSHQEKKKKQHKKTREIKQKTKKPTKLPNTILS